MWEQNKNICLCWVFSFYLCTSLMFTGSWWGKSIHHVNVRGLARDVTMSQWGWMRRKLVVFLLFCIDIWIMDSVLNNDFRILAIVFWITAIVNQYWTVANLYNDYQLIKGAPVCGKIARFWKMSLTLADGEFRDQKILIYLLCFSTIGLFINFYFGTILSWLLVFIYIFRCRSWYC